MNKNNNNHGAAVWGVGLVVAYLLAVWLYMAVGKPCADMTRISGILPMEEWCALAAHSLAK